MLALDHIIIPTSSPQQAAEDFSEQHAVHITKGGSHPDWGTYNYLAYFKNNVYIEWIGIEYMHIAKQSTNPLIQQVVHALKHTIKRPIQYALRTNQLDEYIAHFKANNIPYSGPLKGSRGRPDGSLLEWSMLFPLCETGYLPFLIEWGEQPNTPTDHQFINDRVISSIIDKRPNIRSFKEAFHLPVQGEGEHEPTIHLANGTLSLFEGDDLTFILDK